jgi:2-aminoadipate transaminase
MHKKLDKSSTTPLYIQIREDIRKSIAGGILKSGEKLPPVTMLASMMGVTAATVRRALQDLIDEGLVSSHVGRGTFITSPDLPKMETGEALQAGRRIQQSLAKSLTEMMTLAQKPGVIAFTRGIGDPGTIEKGILNRLTLKALEEGEELFWDYGDPRGLLPLRKAIAALYREQNIDVSPEQVLVTSGSQQAIALIAQQAAENGTTLLCETPCYTGVTNAFSAFGIAIETLIRADDGPDIHEVPSHIDPSKSILYICPVLHNPMGTDMSHEKQREIALWARTSNATILADEVFRDLHLGKSQPASFLADPGPERAVILGSLSKSFISGLRVGWIITSEERVKTLTKIKKAMDLGCPPLMQGIARAYLEDERGFAAHRIRIRDHYRLLRDTTLEALDLHMPKTVSWTKPQGGFQLWVTLPEKFSSIELFLHAVEKGVAFLPGPLQDINNNFINSFRLCYGSLTVDEIRTGIKRLAEAVTKYLDESPGETGRTGLGDF